MDTDSLINRICRLETLNEQLTKERDTLLQELTTLRSNENLENLRLQIELLKRENNDLKNKTIHSSSSNLSSNESVTFLINSAMDTNHSFSSEKLLDDENIIRYDAIQDFLFYSLKSSLERQINEISTSLNTYCEPNQTKSSSLKNQSGLKLQEILSEKKTKLQILESFIKKNQKKSISSWSSNDISSCNTENKVQKKEDDLAKEKEIELTISEKKLMINGIVTALKMANIRYETVDINPGDLLTILNEEKIRFDKWAERIQVELSNLVRY
ncbi:hypothetical protein EDI_295330 [Entamoeba dispar SAW760]|uniref:Uncharacterized protein n=1 Tax=Entamoeba dispar (strain ATCC PRA-260 / SAW760) TaxID=370354 RepID=B0EIA2_ENTDS|nr:uncharacterized protein EDI_295330 [Entamoeba dispar SAW760]EDR25750.1 hypothetical protein EDI_295330 [Entamoeba dispar SAW760]|eukprot:EDR25750.1 hypothetical protein EDI_295330 [Entamoeba dispar SAW760]